ncbi:MAG: PIN domain-containing protein [Mycobacteriales bacterium]
MSNAAVLAPYGNPPLTNREAWGVYEALLADDRVAFVAAEPSGLESCWTEFALQDGASPKLWMDAYLAAFATAGGYRLVTTDVAFRQFPSLDLLVLDQNRRSDALSESRSTPTGAPPEAAAPCASPAVCRPGQAFTVPGPPGPPRRPFQQSHQSQRSHQFHSAGPSAG